MQNLRSLPRIDDRAFVAANATVVGDVSIGEEASVWFTAVIRADYEKIVVGRNSNVQDGAILHADPGFPCKVGEGVTIGHRAIVHGAILEDSCVVGMGATVLNGAVIGEESIVGAGSVVPQYMVIPPRSLVLGVPAKIRRDVTAAELAIQRAAATLYVENGRAYRDAGHGRVTRATAI